MVSGVLVISFKGIIPRRFCQRFVTAVLELGLSTFVDTQILLENQEKNKISTFVRRTNQIFKDFCKTQTQNMKKWAQRFQVVNGVHPGHPCPQRYLL